MRGRAIYFVLAALLLVGLVAGADHDEHDGHDHGDDEDSHEGHDHGEGKFEWAGAFEMGAGQNTLTLAKVGGKYAADRMVVSVRRMRAGEKLADGVLEESEETFEHAMEHLSGGEACSPDAELGTAECPITLTTGGAMDLAGLEPGPEKDHDDHEGHDHGEEDEEDHEGHDHGRRQEDEDHEDHDEHEELSRVFVLEMDQDAPMTFFNVNVAEEGVYALVTEHALSEFDGAVHYLQDADGDDLMAVDTFPAEECNASINMSQVWGYSIAGSMIGAVMSLSGALCIIGMGGTRDFKGRFANHDVLKAFAAGVLLSLVLLHLLPEAVALAGSFSWEVSVCTVSGLLLGLATEHILHLLGFEHSHSGHAHALVPPSDADGEVAHAHQRDVPLARAPVVPQAPSMAVTGMSASVMPYQPQPPMGMSPPQGFPVAPLPPNVPQQPMAVHGANFGATDDSNKKLGDVEGASDGSLSVASPMNSTVVNILVGDFFHNLFDGIAIGSAFLSCGDLGWVVTASVVAHELPQEISDFVILVNHGLSIQKALLFNLFSSLSSIIGVIIVILIEQAGSGGNVNSDIGLMLAFSAGILLYVAVGLLSDVPRVSSPRWSVVTWLALALGVVMIGLLKLWHVHCEQCGAVGGSHEGHNH